jgi:hypothetical protein
MLKLKKKGEKLDLDPDTLCGIRGGHNCGQGCSDSCGTGYPNYENRRTEHTQWRFKNWPETP